GCQVDHPEVRQDTGEDHGDVALENRADENGEQTEPGSEGRDETSAGNHAYRPYDLTLIGQIDSPPRHREDRDSEGCIAQTKPDRQWAIGSQPSLPKNSSAQCLGASVVRILWSH